MVGRPSTGERTQIRVDRQDLQRLEQWAQQHGTTKTAAIREAIARFLADQSLADAAQNARAFRVKVERGVAHLMVGTVDGKDFFYPSHEIEVWNHQHKPGELRRHMRITVYRMTGMPYPQFLIDAGPTFEVALESEIGTYRFTATREHCATAPPRHLAGALRDGHIIRFSLTP